MAIKEIKIENVAWHVHTPPISANGTIYVERKSTSDKKVYIWGNVKHTSSGHYLVPPSCSWNPVTRQYVVYEYAGLTSWIKADSDKLHRTWAKYCPYDGHKQTKVGNYGYKDGTLSFTHTLGTKSEPLEVTWANKGNLYIYSGCIYSLDGDCDHGFDNEVLGELEWKELPYDPYSDPTDYSVTFPEIVRDDKSTNMSYSVVCGSGGSIDWINNEIYPGSTKWNYGKWNNVKGSIEGSRIKSNNIYTYSGSGDRPTKKSGTKGVTPGIGEGKTGRLAIHFSDCHYEWISGDDDYFRTYKKPSMTAKISRTTLSPQDNATVTWTTNSRKWSASNREKNFATSASIGGTALSGVNQGPTSDTDGSSSSSSENNIITLNATTLNKVFDAKARSVKSISTSVTLTRSNTNAGADYDASDTKDFKIQYQPVLEPSSVSKKANNKDLTEKIYIQTVKKINVSWGYQGNSGGAGVVSGYYVEVFTNSDCTGTPYFSKAVADSSYTGSIELDTKTNLKRGVMNYIKITPYYTCPDTTVTADYIDANHRIRGTKSHKSQLCIPISRINTPSIDYPVNNSTWHNRYFRVLLQLPTDDDVSELVADKTIAKAEDYRYQNIEIKVTYPDNTSVTYNTSTNAIWSTDTFSHERKIAICPALSSLKDTASYKVKVRVQKNYYITDGDESWSEWSSEIVVKRQTVSVQNYVVGDKVEDTHYMNPRTASVNCHGVYPIHTLPTNNISRADGDKIEYKHYQAIYDTILQIKNDVNSYCTYDRATVSFDRTISDFTDDAPKVEEITASDIGTRGRNYMNLLVKDLNQLY